MFSGILSFSSNTWFQKQIVEILEKRKALESIKLLLQQRELPPKLMVELLKPYVYNLHSKKVTIKSFSTKLFPVFKQ